MTPSQPHTPIASPAAANARARTSRRQFMMGAVGVVGAAAAARALGGGFASGGGLLDASGVPLSGAADAESAAERLGPPPVAPVELEVPPEGRIAFPIDPTAKSYVLDNYGDCRGSARRHIGVDIISERGAEVYAVAAGRLVQAYENTGLAGWGWTLRTDDDVDFKYFHLDKWADGLEKGDEVAFGDVIGYVGSTGNFISDDDGERIEDRNNIHLHFEYWPERRVSADALPLLEVPDDISIGPPLKPESCASRG